MENFLMNEKMEKMEENLTKLFRNLSENEFKMKIL
jgi:hypothetical protein